MPLLFVMAIIALAVAIGGVAASVVAKGSQGRYDDVDWRRVGRIVGATAAGLAVLLTLFGSLTTVSTKKVGIVTAFGKPTAVLSNGIHVRAPWEKLTEFDAAIQTDDHIADRKTDDASGDGPCLTVRIANQATACADVSIRWRIRQDAADDLYRDYKDFGNVRRSLVSRDLTAAMNEVFAEYDPLAGLNNDPAKAASASATLGQLGEQVTGKLRAKIDRQIEILSVVVPLVRHDGQTQDKINAYQAALADTRIAEQRKATATQEAATNRILGESVKGDGVLEQRCLDLVREIYRMGKEIPPGFSCFAGSNVPIIAGSTK